jgi:putative transposase
MRTAYKCRAYPDPEQAHVLNRTFGCVRVAWNRTLAWRQQRYQADKTRTTYAQASTYLTALKATDELAWLNEVSSVPLQQAIRHQQAAMDVRHPGSSRVRSAVKQEPRRVRAGIPVHQGRE